MLIRISVGAALGGVIGYERDRHRRPVGLRTHLIVAMTAATFMVISSQFVYFQHYGKDDLVVVDASRIAASVVAGIGFLAGGAILRTGFNVQGLTTAAGLWLVTAIGMCSGSGMFVESGFVTLMGLTALTVLRRLEDKNDRQWMRRLSVTVDSSKAAEQVLTTLKGLGASVAEVDYQLRTGDAPDKVTLTVDVQMPDDVTVRRASDAIEAVEGVRGLHLRHPY
ncbi:MAG TPA: MgtC/SapB family protein [Polyangiaceae bacterium]|jgi:putative Mg2+ transporter-C (MgtC) family protein|nr:MgtC/SapB family protein [Polyangiaceae bacterium]